MTSIQIIWKYTRKIILPMAFAPKKRLCTAIKETGENPEMKWWSFTRSHTNKNSIHLLLPVVGWSLMAIIALVTKIWCIFAYLVLMNQLIKYLCQKWRNWKNKRHTSKKINFAMYICDKNLMISYRKRHRENEEINFFQFCHISICKHALPPSLVKIVSSLFYSEC